MVPQKATYNVDKTGHSKMTETITSAVRLQRNQAEKQRRDRLNGYISELATLVPMVKNSSKPVDKVSVLRLAAAHMRLNVSCLNPARFKTKLTILPSSITSYLEILEKNIGGFVVATTFAGVVVFCSKSVEDFLGYQNIDFMGQSIYNFVSNKEISHFEKKINSVITLYKAGNFKKGTKSLKLHLQKRPLPRTNDISYQKVEIKISVHSNEVRSDPSKEEKTSGKGKKILKHKDFGTTAVLLFFIEPAKSTPKNPFLLKDHDVYVTLHGIRGEIIEADHNISTITGYMPCDVLGKSAYEFIMESDVPIAQFAQKAMFTSNDGKGIITYRLRTFDQKNIYLQSLGQLFKDSANEIQRFVCYNRWLSDKEGEFELKKFQERFSPALAILQKSLQQKNNPESTVVSLESPEEKDLTNGNLNDSSFCAHSNDLVRNSEEFQKDSNDVGMAVAKCTKNVKSPVNEASVSLNGNEFHNGNGYLCNQPIEIYKESNGMDINVKLKQNALGNGYDVEKMEVCSFQQTTDFISGENGLKQEKRVYDALTQSLNSREIVQDLSFAQYSNTFVKNGSDSSYFNTRNGDANCTLYEENKILPSVEDPYNGHAKQMPSSVQPLASPSYQKLSSDHNSNFINYLPSHMSFYKVTENVLYNNNMGMPIGPYNSTIPSVPSLKNNLKDYSYDQCNGRQVRLLDGDCGHRGDHLNSSENVSYHRIEPLKTATCSNGFSHNGNSVYGDVDVYGNGSTNHDAFGFQKVISPKNGMLNGHHKSIHSTQVGDCNFPALPSRDKWELLNNSCDAKNRNKSSEVINSKDSRYVLESYSETVHSNGNLCEKPTNESCIAIPSSNHESNFDSRVNQELYNELDMFFENFPLADSAQNDCSF